MITLRKKTIRLAATLPKGEARDELLQILASTPRQADLDADTFADIQDVADEFAYSPFNYLGNSLLDEATEYAGDALDLKLSWDIYRTRDVRSGIAFVANMKGRGAADYDDIVEAAAKQIGVSEEAIKDYFTDSFYMTLWDEDVRIFLDELRTDPAFKDLDLAVVGRSGGYWGCQITIEMFSAEGHESAIFQDIRKRMPKDIDEDEDARWFAEEVLLDHGEHFTKYVEFGQDYAKAIKRLDEALAAESKWWEKPEKWVDAIEANEYYTPDFDEE